MQLSDHPRVTIKRELIMATRASVKVEHWKVITPETLVAPVEHIRKMFDEGVWKCSHLTEKLCFAGLHPEDNQIDLDPYKAPFSTYLEIIGPAAAQKFDRDHQGGTPPAIFHAFQQVMAAGIRSEIQRLFNDLLQIAMVHSASLNEHPVEWAKAHLSILINSKKHLVKLWIKSVCDKQDYSKMGKTQQETEDFIFWRYWRAPKLIYMQPSGNLPYDSSTAWIREDEAMTEQLLEGLSDQFILFLGFYLDKLAGDAHVGLAKTGETVSAARTPEKLDEKDAENPDRRFAAMAIEEASKSVPEDERPHPKVGAVVVKDGKVLTKAHRGENPKPKSHAEYIALEEKLPDDLVAGATVYTTLEPCTTRKHPKIPCARRLIDRRVGCVVIGMLDPNPEISGKGWQLLREAGIEIRVFNHDLMQLCEEMNREFIRSQKGRQASAKMPTTNEDQSSWPDVILECQWPSLVHEPKIPGSHTVRRRPWMLRHRGTGAVYNVRVHDIDFGAYKARFPFPVPALTDTASIHPIICRKSDGLVITTHDLESLIHNPPSECDVRQYAVEIDGTEGERIPLEDFILEVEIPVWISYDDKNGNRFKIEYLLRYDAYTERGEMIRIGRIEKVMPK